MGSFGERLRREREMRGITIEEIAEATKIGSRNLHALENEKFDLLPGGIFNKGFVRAYSKYLGLDEEQAVADYIAAETAFREPQSEAKSEPVEAEERSFAAPIVVVLVVVLAAGGYFGWRYYQNRVAQREAEKAAAAAQKTFQTTPAPAPAIAVTAPSAAPADSSSDSSHPAETPATTSSTTTAASPDMAAAPSSADGFIVQLKAKQDSWVSAKADGKSVFSATLKAQNEKTLRARDRMEVMLGNAGGIQVSYNGKDLNLPNTSGQVRTLIFTALGLQPDKPE